MDLEEKLQTLIEEKINNNNITEATSLTLALAAIQSAGAQTLNAVNIEKTLAIFAEIGESLKQAAGQFDSAALTKMMGQGK